MADDGDPINFNLGGPNFFGRPGGQELDQLLNGVAVLLVVGGGGEVGDGGKVAGAGEALAPAFEVFAAAREAVGDDDEWSRAGGLGEEEIDLDSFAGELELFGSPGETGGGAVAVVISVLPIVGGAAGQQSDQREAQEQEWSEHVETPSRDGSSVAAGRGSAGRLNSA